MNINELIVDYLLGGGEVTHYPLNTCIGFPIDWNEEKNPFIMTPDYSEIFKKVRDLRRNYKNQKALTNFDESKMNVFRGNITNRNRSEY